MNIKLNVTITALVLFAGLSLGLILHKNQLTQSVQAQTAENDKARQWQHCSVFPLNGVNRNAGKVTGAAVISYIYGGGFQTEKIEATVDESANSLTNAENSALAKAISKLGNDGWEMVGEGTLFPADSGDQKVLYFKRRKQ